MLANGVFASIHVEALGELDDALDLRIVVCVPRPLGELEVNEMCLCDFEPAQGPVLADTSPLHHQAHVQHMVLPRLGSAAHCCCSASPLPHAGSTTSPNRWCCASEGTHRKERRGEKQGEEEQEQRKKKSRRRGKRAEGDEEEEEERRKKRRRRVVFCFVHSQLAFANCSGFNCTT